MKDKMSEEEIQRFVKKIQSGRHCTKKEFERYLNSLDDKLLLKGIEKAIKEGIFDKNTRNKKLWMQASNRCINCERTKENCLRMKANKKRDYDGCCKLCCHVNG